jgi:hypothetical protein
VSSIGENKKFGKLSCAIFKNNFYHQNNSSAMRYLLVLQNNMGGKFPVMHHY